MWAVGEAWEEREEEHCSPRRWSDSMVNLCCNRVLSTERHGLQIDLVMAAYLM